MNYRLQDLAASDLGKRSCTLSRFRYGLIRIIIITMLVIFFDTTPSQAQAPHSEFYQYKMTFYRTISEGGLLDKRIDSEFSSILANIINARDSNRKISINKEYNDSVLNIYLVDAKKIEHIAGTLRLLNYPANINKWIEDALARLKNNAFAFDRNMIVFDTYFLANFALSGFNGMLMFSQYIGETTGAGLQANAQNEETQIAQRYSIIADRQRLRNIRNAKDHVVPGREPIALLVPLFKAATSENASSMISYPLFPIVMHELGHLDTATAGSFSTFKPSCPPTTGDNAAPIARDRNATVVEEQRADSYAADWLRSILKKSTPREMMLITQGVIETEKFLRDDVLVRAFSGFRGLETEDYFINIEHNLCTNNGYKNDSMFADIDFVNNGYFRFAPLLTNTEFNMLSRKVSGNLCKTTHPHNFLRASNMLKVIQDELGVTLEACIIAPQLDMLGSFIAADPKMIAPPYTGHTGISFSTLIKGLGDLNIKMEMNSAVNCPTDKCWIVRFENDTLGFLEVVGPEKDIAYARLIMPMFGEDTAGLDSTTDQKGYINSSLLFMFFMRNAMSRDIDLTLGNVISSIRLDMLKCGGTSRTFFFDRRKIMVRTVNEKLWVSIEIVPKN